MDPSTDILPLLKVADATIHDASGTLFDAVLANKPIIIVDKPGIDLGVSANTLFKNIGIHCETNLHSLVNCIEKVLSEPDLCQEERFVCSTQMFSYQDGKSGK